MEKKKRQQDPVPYLHELTDNPYYEIKTLIPEKFQVGNPNDWYTTAHKLFFDQKENNLIAYSRKEPSSSSKKLLYAKISTSGKVISTTNSLGDILNNGLVVVDGEYSTWILNNDTTYHKLEPLLEDDEKDNIEKWLPKFKEAYLQAEYVYLPTSFTEYHMLINGTWYFMGRQEDTPSRFRDKYPAKNPPGRMMALEDVTPDFFVDPAKRDTSLLKVLGYGQEYFEEGQGANPINGSAGHYYMQLNMQKDSLRFKRFGTMKPQLTIYKISEELGGHPDVVFIVQTRNEMFPDREFGGMYVVRPRKLKENN